MHQLLKLTNIFSWGPSSDSGADDRQIASCLALSSPQAGAVFHVAEAHAAVSSRPAKALQKGEK